MVERSVGIGVLEVSENNFEGMVSITYETTLPENRKLNTLTWLPYRITPHWCLSAHSLGDVG